MPPAVGRVVALHRYPLKSARGESVAELDLDGRGVPGDRAWACVDPADHSVGSAKHPGRWGALLGVRATLEGGSTVLEVAGSTVVAGTAEADAALGRLLGRPVRLTRTVPAGALLHRRMPEDAAMVPDWMSEALPGSERLDDVTGARPGGRFVDFTDLHLLTTGALAGLADEHGRQVDPAPFRANLVVDAPRDPEVGDVLSVGGALLEVVLPTPRCIVPGLDHGAGPDPALLSTLAKHHRVPVGDRGRGACFGVYARVLRPGRLAVGDAVEMAAADR